MVSTAPMATRFFSPPDSVYGARSSSFSMRSCAAASPRTRASTSSRASPSCSGPKAQLVEDVGAEELHVGLLEDEADARAELAAERRVLERVLGQRRRRTRRRVPAAAEHEPVEHLEQRRLAGAVGAHDRDVLAGAAIARSTRRGPTTARRSVGRGQTRRGSEHGAVVSRDTSPVDAEGEPARVRPRTLERAMPSRSGLRAQGATSEGIAPEKPRASMAS